MGIYGVSNKGRYFENWQETFYISGSVTQANLGAAVTLDKTANATVKLAGAGDPIFGRLEVLEPRNQEGITVCTVSLKLKDWLPTDGTTVAVGDSVVGGATAGTVKTAGAGGTNKIRGNDVIFVDAANSRVHVILQ